MAEKVTTATVDIHFKDGDINSIDEMKLSSRALENFDCAYLSLQEYIDMNTDFVEKFVITTATGREIVLYNE